MGGVGINRVGGLLDAPPAAGHDHGILDDVAGLQGDIVSLLVFLYPVAGDSLKQQHAASVAVTKANRCEIASFAIVNFTVPDRGAGGEPRTHQRCPFTNCAMAIDATNFNCGARLVIQNPVAVNILAKVAINTMHPLLKMNVIEVDGFVKSIGVVG